MKKYIVNIYRGEKNKPRSLVGVVEDVGIEGKKAFTNYDELWEIVNPGNQKEIKGSGQSQPNDVDQRRHHRSETSCFSEYSLDLSPGDDVSHGVITNMSKSGLCIYTPKTLNEGENIFIKCDINSPVQRATVRWCKQYMNRHYKAGVEFLSSKGQESSA